MPPEAVGPLVRGLAVLRALAGSDAPQPVTALVRATGLARSTVDRLLATLGHLGYVRAEGRDVAPAPRLMALGNAYLAAVRLPELLGPHADELAGALDESVSLAVPDRDATRFVHQATRRRAMTLTFRIGDPLPAERGATGPLFAAGWDAAAWDAWRRRRAADPLDAGFPGLPPHPAPPRDEAAFRTRVTAAARDGYACDDQLVEPGLVAVAVPVLGPHGRPVCAVSVVSHTSRHTARSLRAAAFPRLRRAVTAMERTLREPPPPPAPAPTPDRLAVPEGAVTVESFARGLEVLAAFDAGRATPTLSELAAATALPRATVRRALITLGHLGYTEAAGRGFRPTPRVLELGFAPLARRPLSLLAQPHLAELTLRVGDSASLAVLDGTDIRYVARVPTVRIMSVNITVGTRFPAFATSMGRVLLAGLPPADRTALLAATDLTPPTPRSLTSPAALATAVERAGADGYALVDQELEEGLRSVAVPVRDHRGRVVAAANVSTHAGRRTPDAIRRDVLPELRSTADAIGADLREAGRFVRVGSE